MPVIPVTTWINSQFRTDLGYGREKIVIYLEQTGLMSKEVEMTAAVIVRETLKTGKGVFAGKDYRKDEFILCFEGDVVEGELTSFPEDLQNHLHTLGDNRWLLPQPPWMYLNHSCEPNAGIKNNVELVAFKDIKKGEQICFDYAMANNTAWTMECHCGSKNCRKLIGNFNMLDEETKKRYMNYASDFIKRDYTNKEKYLDNRLPKR
ncbi:MAG: SET domain-containing protein-lysine N-methyltransferase [Chloroflexota bacterium]